MRVEPDKAGKVNRGQTMEDIIRRANEHHRRAFNWSIQKDDKIISHVRKIFILAVVLRTD